MNHRTELRLLVELDRLGNARRVAESLNLSQSTISEALARLERDYGTRLFDRDRTGSRPTGTGQLVVDAARRSLEALDNAQREVDLLEGFERGSLSVAAHPCLVDTLLVPAVAAVVGDSTNLQCHVGSDSPDGLLAGLRSRQLELFVGLTPDAPSDDIHIQPIGTYRPIPFCRIDHPLAAVAPQGISVLREYPFVTTDAPQWYAERVHAGLPVDPALAGDLIERGRRVHVTQMSAMESIVKNTDALGLAPLDAIRPGIDAGELIALDVPQDQRVILEPVPIVIATMHDRPLPPSAHAVIAALRNRTPEPEHPDMI